MKITPAKQFVLTIAVAMSLTGVAPAAHAEDFLSALFGAFSGRSRPVAQPSAPLPFANDGSGSSDVNGGSYMPRARTTGGRQAFCVRTCDGRYFPISASDGQSRAASCNNFCPASETKIVYGGTIDNAVTDAGKSYAALPNAFRYRTELVAGCTCNGRDQTGLAPVKLENDPTLRKGDMIAGAQGLTISHSARRLAPDDACFDVEQSKRRACADSGVRLSGAALQA